MKERCLNVLKWFFIILGIIFFIQILIVLFAVIQISVGPRINFDGMVNFSPSKNNLKKIQPIINYVEDYKNKNNKYPEKISEDIKINKKTKYTYELSKDSNCYTITLNSDKDNLVKQYQRCSLSSQDSSSNSESYFEYTK